MLKKSLLIACLLFFAANCDTAAQAPKFVELVLDQQSYQGKIVARNPEHVWLMERTGALRTLSVGEITSFRKLSNSFTPNSAGDQRDQLRRELGAGIEIVGTGHYLVAGPPAVVRNYANIFEDQYRAVFTHFSVRGHDVHPPEFPLIAIVFPDVGSFAKYAAKDKVPVRPGLKGYYIQSTNRVALFHENQPARASTLFPGPQFTPSNDRPFAATTRPPLLFEKLLPDQGWANIDGDLEATMIHETTHQVAFNIGIHQRVGQTNPRWVVEGLATVFEAPGMRNSGLANTPGAKLNQMRLSGFREFHKHRRQAHALVRHVESDHAFAENVLDGYAQAWALSFFLIETRPREYAKFLRLIAARPVLEQYTEEQRVADFKAAFGNDVALLDAHFVRFIQELK